MAHKKSKTCRLAVLAVLSVLAASINDRCSASSLSMEPMDVYFELLHLRLMQIDLSFVLSES